MDTEKQIFLMKDRARAESEQLQRKKKRHLVWVLEIVIFILYILVVVLIIFLSYRESIKDEQNTYTESEISDTINEFEDYNMQEEIG